MTVYIEYVIIDNLIIDFLILKATFSLTKISYGKRRLFLCSLLGSIIALVYPLLEIEKVILTIVKIFSGLLLLLLANDYKNFKTFYVNSIVFFLLVFLTGGAVIGIYNIFNIPLAQETSVAFVILPVYLVIKGVIEFASFIYKKKEVVCFTYDIELKVFGESQKAKGFLDTGNCSFDNGQPIIFCNQSFAKKLLKENIAKVKFTKILITTATGENQNFSFPIDELILYKGDKAHIYKNIMVCIAKGLSQNYDIILHPSLFKEKNYEQIDRENKKVS